MRWWDRLVCKYVGHTPDWSYAVANGIRNPRCRYCKLVLPEKQKGRRRP